MEQLEKVDSTIEQLEYYQHDRCDVLIIHLLLLSLMKKVRARKVCRTDMSEGQKCNSNQNVIFIHLIAIERRRIPIRNGKTYFNNVIQSRLCYNKILIFLSVRHKIKCWAPFSYSIQKKMFSIPFPPFFGWGLHRPCDNMLKASKLQVSTLRY